MLIHVPNEGRRETRLVMTKAGPRYVCTAGKRLKAEGMVTGVADLLLLKESNGHGCLAIEMKYGKGDQSKYQKQWQKECTEAGNVYVVCKTVRQFFDSVFEYLGYGQDRITFLKDVPVIDMRKVRPNKSVKNSVTD